LLIGNASSQLRGLHRHHAQAHRPYTGKPASTPDGIEALTLLRNDGISPSRRLVPPDRNMGRMNGIELLRESRADPARQGLMVRGRCRAGHSNVGSRGCAHSSLAIASWLNL
jgi:CheY-like chemotaxis protein